MFLCLQHRDRGRQTEESVHVNASCEEEVQEEEGTPRRRDPAGSGPVHLPAGEGEGGGVSDDAAD